MDTKNIYHLPITVGDNVALANDSLAHTGDLINSIDFDAPEGTPIFAALAGIVIAVKDDSQIGGLDQSFENDGNFIEILHANNEISEYEHLRNNSSKIKLAIWLKQDKLLRKLEIPVGALVHTYTLWFIPKDKNIKH